MMKINRWHKNFLALTMIGLLLFPSLGMSKEEQKTRINVSVDPGIELLYIIDAVSDAERYHNCQLMNTIYRQQAMRHFDAHRNHSAIRMYREEIKKNYCLLDLEKTFLTLPHSMNIEEWQEDAIEDEILYAFIVEAMQFYRQAYVNWFLEDMTMVTGEVKRIFNAMLSQQTWKYDILELFQGTVDEVQIMLSPLKHAQHRSHWSIDESESIFYLILGLTEIKNGFLVFASADDFQQLMLKHASSRWMLYEISQLEEDYEILIQHLSEREDDWIALGHDCPASFIAYQASSVLYWEFMDAFLDTYTLPEKMKEAYEGGYFLINSIAELMDHWLHCIEDEQQYWADFAPEFMDGLIDCFDGQGKE